MELDLNATGWRYTVSCCGCAFTGGPQEDPTAEEQDRWGVITLEVLERVLEGPLFCVRILGQTVVGLEIRPDKGSKVLTLLNLS